MSIRKMYWYYKFSLSLLRKIRFRLLGAKFENGLYLAGKIYVHTYGNISIGKNCSIGEFSRFWNYALIEIGDDFIGAAGVTFLTGTHDPNTLEPFSDGILIGKRVWCGANVSILPGAVIGDDVVIASGAVVKGCIQNSTIIGGVPAKTLKFVDMEIRRNGTWRQGAYKF